MTRNPDRTDRASRLIKVPPHAVHRAFMDPAALARWLPPTGMAAEISAFEPRAGGAFRMALTYENPAPSLRGKTTESTDVVEGRFLELVENERIVQAVTFRSDDPAFAGEMRMTWSLAPVPGGTEVTVTAENVPPGISREDHEAGLNATLANFAAFLA
ncbi:SRPBCC family protein [Chelativorans sp. M5D2P16]|uniref:SRPBCC family protein n=1 Tax=Chelativorans sp. M5D2P16 TaxID=3095678 RepID=UPI002ACADD26|nr:SRPBCC family protein [Chelativorans sp. M5D2P16]MDZ5696808.1 SRPBCC family protein [Chelativorans sp. M5D2P16]